MIREERQKLKKLDVEAKVEDDHNFITKAPSSSRQWSLFKNPRIVRVSRAFGGKDRHSKVATVRGLRDRRIRLSVPTAIQLYDLQDRLGLSQPSKVVDWLLDVTKYEIDKLPPLQMAPAPGNFNHFYNPNLNLNSNALETSFSPFFNADLCFLIKDGASQCSMPSNDVICENSYFGNEEMMGKSKVWNLDSTEQNQDGSNYNPHVFEQDFFPISSQSSFPNMINNSIPYNPFYPMEPNSDLSLSQLENHRFQNHVQGENSSHLQTQPAPTLSIFPQHNDQYIGSSMDNNRHGDMVLSNPFLSSAHLHSQCDF